MQSEPHISIGSRHVFDGGIGSHAPPVHIMPVSQACPHAPQLASSLAGAMHAPPQLSWLVWQTDGSAQPPIIAKSAGTMTPVIHEIRRMVRRDDNTPGDRA